MKSLVILLVILGVAGCSAKKQLPAKVAECKGFDQRQAQNEPALVSGKYGFQQATPIPLNAVQFTDKWLAKNIAVQGLYAERTQTDRIEVSARLINCSDNTLALGLRTSFLKESQAPAEKPSEWQTVIVGSKATATYQEKSISQDVHSYFIELRPTKQGSKP